MLIHLRHKVYVQGGLRETRTAPTHGFHHALALVAIKYARVVLDCIMDDSIGFFRIRIRILLLKVERSYKRLVYRRRSHSQETVSGPPVQNEIR